MINKIRPRQKAISSLIYLPQLGIAGLGLLTALTIVIQSDTSSELSRMVGLSFAFWGLFWIVRRRFSIPVVVIILTLEIVVIIFGMRQIEFFNILFLIVGVQAIQQFGGQVGLVVTFGIVLINFGIQLGSQPTLQHVQDGVVNGFLIFFFASLVATVDFAKKAQNESDSLFKELQETHERLKAYTQQIEELAVAEERNRLSRELHDTLGHRLTVSIVQLEGATKLLKTDVNRSESMMKTVLRQLDEGLGDVRQTVSQLRSTPQINLSLPNAMDQLLKDFKNGTNLKVTHSIPKEISNLPDNLHLALMRVAQESLTNIQKHSQATSVWLTLKANNASIELIIEDDGIGIIEGNKSQGYGLKGIQERAKILGGLIEIKTQHLQGTLIRFCIPRQVEADV